MKEWIINNTFVTKEKYDNLINEETFNNRKIEDNMKINTEHPLYPVCNFTLKKPTKLRCKFYKIKRDEKYYLHKDLKFRVLAETIFDKRDPYIKELYSRKRVGTCFMKSLTLSYNLKGSNIITAVCDEPFINPTKPFLHAFVCCVGKDGKEYILDATLNIIIEKDTYIKLLNARIISEIDGQKAQNDGDLIRLKNLGHSILVHEYLCFPNEVMEGVKKYIKTR